MAAYAGTLAAGFVWDDNLMVLQNPWLRDFASIQHIFVASEVGYRPDMAVNYYRPIKNLAYLATYQLAGATPWAFHLVNVLLHAGATALVLLVCRRFLSDYRTGRGEEPRSLDGWASFAAAAIFAVHPVHVEPVAWIAALPELAYSAAGMVSLLAFARWRSAPGRAWYYVASLATFGLALLSKEPAVAWLVILVAYDWAVLGRTGLRERLWALPYVGALGAYLALRSYALGGFVPTQALEGLSPWLAVLNAFPLLADYLIRLVFPWPLSAFHAFAPVYSLAEPKVLWSLGLVAALGVVAAMLLARRHPASFALAVIVSPLAPVLYVRAVGENAFAERYLYLPSVGLSVLLALGISSAARRVPRSRFALAGVATAVVAVLAYSAVQRTRVWQDDLTLWADNAQTAPTAYTPQVAVGQMLAGSGRFAEAIPYFEAALRVARTEAPDVSETQRKERLRTSHNNLGLAFLEVGAAPQAAEHLHAALALDPRAPETHNNLGLLAMRTGEPRRAVFHYVAALELSDAAPAGVYRNLARAYEAAGMPREAAAVSRFLQGAGVPE